MLIVLYALALFADPLSPATMLWTDKTKSYQPPTGVRFSYLDGGRLVVRPFVYEMHIVNQALRTYGRVPRHTVRVVSQERAAGRAELRSLAMQEDAAARSRASLAAVQRHYRLAAPTRGSASCRRCSTRSSATRGAICTAACGCARPALRPRPWS